ncbi:hypothetical protein SLH46_06940 [Draconibacterium sp. IB214405]|uniref:hypothetical protein n=1 Tax=Draconibacterium sp. IB214405 TaxID=3097352 RepID=UPI002A0EC2FE|nr:hypothetical protein [Draconibacterium sp. IB214405]MDX8338911.1 hypothetical protein [Draconibacterium sp. IB214405]
MFLKEKFYEGGPAFMGILTILFVITVAWFIYQFVVAYSSQAANAEQSLRKLAYGKTLGLFAMITGLLGQLIGFTGIFDAMELAAGAGEEVQPALVYGGLKVTMICSIYGMLIYLFSILLWFVSTAIIEKRMTK